MKKSAPIDEAIARFGAALMPQSGQVMTQCNAGAWPRPAVGRDCASAEQGRKLRVYRNTPLLCRARAFTGLGIGRRRHSASP